MKKRIHRTKEERIRLYNDYTSSSLSKKAWCSLNNIPPTTLDTWKKFITKDNKNELVFITPKPRKDKENSPSISKVSSNNINIHSFNTVLEIGICKLHINETTPFSFIEEIIKVVKEADV